MALPVILGIGTVLIAIGKWAIEFALMYGRKVAFYFVVVALFFAALSTISFALFSAYEQVSASSYFAAVSPYLSIATAVFPTNFLSIASLIIAIEFQIFFWRWAMKVLDLKVNFFGS